MGVANYTENSSVYWYAFLKSWISHACVLHHIASWTPGRSINNSHTTSQEESIQETLAVL